MPFRSTRVDFTKKRLGTVVSQWTYLDRETKKQKVAQTVIAKCPKCGKKGERTVRRGKDNKCFYVYTHSGDIEEAIPGFPIFIVRDRCEVQEP